MYTTISSDAFIARQIRDFENITRAVNSLDIVKAIEESYLFDALYCIMEDASPTLLPYDYGVIYQEQQPNPLSTRLYLTQQQTTMLKNDMLREYLHNRAVDIYYMDPSSASYVDDVKLRSQLPSLETIFSVFATPISHSMNALLDMHDGSCIKRSTHCTKCFVEHKLGISTLPTVVQPLLCLTYKEHIDDAILHAPVESPLFWLYFERHQHFQQQSYPLNF